MIQQNSFLEISMDYDIRLQRYKVSENKSLRQVLSKNLLKIFKICV